MSDATGRLHRPLEPQDLVDAYNKIMSFDPVQSNTLLNFNYKHYEKLGLLSQDFWKTQRYVDRVFSHLPDSDRQAVAQHIEEYTKED